MDDVLIRLDPLLQEDAGGRFDPAIYAINLAIVEAFVTRRDVAIDPTDETRLGVDLDGDGVLDRATRITFGGATGRSAKRSLQYVGRARARRRPARSSRRLDSSRFIRNSCTAFAISISRPMAPSGWPHA